MKTAEFRFGGIGYEALIEGDWVWICTKWFDILFKESTEIQWTNEQPHKKGFKKVSLVDRNFVKIGRKQIHVDPSLSNFIEENGGAIWFSPVPVNKANKAK